MRFSWGEQIAIGVGLTVIGGVLFAEIFGPRKAHAASPDLPREVPPPTPTPTPTPPPEPVAVRARYVPGSPEQFALFEQAALVAGLPKAWARDPGLVNILTRESGGWVGILNYTYGDRKKDSTRWPEVWAELRAGKITAHSSATGLGQLLLRNVDIYYPGKTVAERRAGIGVAVNEAVGMLRYIKARYGTPAKAWALYGKLHEGY